MTFDATFWASVAFVLFIALVFKPLSGLIGRGLDGRAARIKAELDEAKKLKEAAQAILANYERDQLAASEEVSTILKRAKEEAKRITQQGKERLEREVEKRIQMAEQKIKQAEAAVIKELRDNAVDITTSAARTLIMENLSREAADEIIAHAISDLDRKLH